jgi:predicted ATPase
MGRKTTILNKVAATTRVCTVNNKTRNEEGEMDRSEAATHRRARTQARRTAAHTIFLRVFS